MSLKNDIKGFRSYLMLERSLSENSVESYIRDVKKLIEYLELNNIKVKTKTISTKEISAFIRWVAEIGMSASSQAEFYLELRLF